MADASGSSFKSTNSHLTAERQPQKRRPHSKSRRGCANCKKRRVKCDETHPVCKNCEHLGLDCAFKEAAQNQQARELLNSYAKGPLNMVDLQLFYNYLRNVWPTISNAGICNDQIWGTEVPQLAFEFPFLMHAILTFSATYMMTQARKNSPNAPPPVSENVITVHRGYALQFLREEVLKVTARNLDALVAASILLILDSLANASSPDATAPSSLPASAWLHHVRGAATILISVSPLPPESRFYKLVNTELRDLAVNAHTEPAALADPATGMSTLECFDDDLKDLYPLHTSSPYFQALAYLDKLLHQRFKPDFILRVFSFPALLDKELLERLIQGDVWSKRIIGAYYKLVRSFAMEMKQSVWFLEGVSKVLPIDMDEEFGGLGFISKALLSYDDIGISRTLKTEDLGINPTTSAMIEQIIGRDFDTGIQAGVNMELLGLQEDDIKTTLADLKNFTQTYTNHHDFGQDLNNDDTSNGS